MKRSELETQFDKGCWSDNYTQGYVDASMRYKAHLQEALELLDVNHQLSAEAFDKAAYALHTMIVNKRLGNELGRKFELLKKEVMALRSGVPITYSSPMEDPASEEYRSPHTRENFAREEPK